MSSLAYENTGTQDEDQDVLIQFEDTAFEPTIPSEENFEDQVREAQEQLEQLRHREEQLERQKQELEELHERKASFAEGRIQLTEDLKRAITSLEREADESQRRSDQCQNAQETLSHYLRSIESIRPENWSRSQLKEELSRAQVQLNEAEEELGSQSSLLASILGTKGKSLIKRVAGNSRPNATGQGFLYWFQSGLAFTLPIMIFVAIFGMFFLMLGGS